MPDFKRTCHVNAWALLRMMNASFLADAKCCFAGGTRMSMEMGEYRASNDVDFLCSDSAGWRDLRRAAFGGGLGRIFRQEPRLPKGVRNDRYGIRCFVNVNGEAVKLEIIHAEQPLSEGVRLWGLGIPVLSRKDSIAQKFMANASRGADRAFLSRDIIDLSFACAEWGMDEFLAGKDAADREYGAIWVEGAVTDALALWANDADHRSRCLESLDVDLGDARLQEGMEALNGLGREPVPSLGRVFGHGLQSERAGR